MLVEGRLGGILLDLGIIGSGLVELGMGGRLGMGSRHYIKSVRRVWWAWADLGYVA